MIPRVKVFPDSYVDSVVQLGAIRAMRDRESVEWANAAMATPANVKALQDQGVPETALAGAGASDFFLVVRAGDDEAAEAALAAGEAAAFAARPGDPGQDAPTTPRSLGAAIERQPATSVSVVSVPGPYAALAAYQSLAAGLHVLLFSDNVPLEKEIALKDFARRCGRFVMGPGAGTAMLGGVGLGFANVVRPGPVGVVAAAGTGAQEAMSLLDRWGVGVSQVVGLGGHDLSSQVGGAMALSAIASLRADPETSAILLVSKPPAAEVATAVLAAAAGMPMVAALVGLTEPVEAPPRVLVTDTLESGVAAMVRLLGHSVPDTSRTWGPSLEVVRNRLSASRTLVRGLYSGGTLCYEALVLLARCLGEVRSNTPVNAAWGLPAPPGSHLCLDLGEEEYTRDRPHPMIDAQARLDVLEEQAADPQVAAIVLDVVLGHAAHPDPAGVLAPTCREIMADGGPQVVAYVLGTDADPQDFTAQRQTMVDAGCIVTETAARAALAAAAISTGNLDLVGRQL